jgi:hypothetical protein
MSLAVPGDDATMMRIGFTGKSGAFSFGTAKHAGAASAAQSSNARQ